MLLDLSQVKLEQSYGSVVHGLEEIGWLAIQVRLIYMPSD